MKQNWQFYLMNKLYSTVCMQEQNSCVFVLSTGIKLYSTVCMQEKNYCECVLSTWIKLYSTVCMQEKTIVCVCYLQELSCTVPLRRDERTRKSQ